MKARFALLPALCAALWSAAAATPAPEQLLPADTLAMMTVANWQKACADWDKTPAAKLWADPSMKPFRDKFMAKVKSDVVEPLEKELGIKLADYSELARGQVTLAVVQGGWKGDKDQAPGLLLLVDSADKSDRLKEKLAELRKRWVDAGKKVKTEKIRDVEFSTLVVDNDELAKSLKKVLPDGDGDESPETGKKTEITLGQSGSLLLIGNDAKTLEKILIRQSGGAVPFLAEQADFAARQSAMFRDAMSYGWVNLKPIIEIITKQLPKDAGGGGDNPLSQIKPEKVFEVLGLTGLKQAAYSFSQSSDGGDVNLFLGAPETSRRGIFKMLTAEAKESSPPAFVPADVTRFTRWRLDGQKMWATLESMLNDISPQIGGLLQMSLGAAGKDRDPNFDFKRNIIGNLGDDIITYEKKPRSAKLEDLTSVPSIVLIGSANAEQLASALRTGTSFLNMGGAVQAGEREFLGRKIYSLPPLPTAARGSAPKKVSYAASGGYVAFSTDTAMLEEYLRGAEGQGRPLRETAGLIEATQKIGGMSTGLFSYENQTETVRLMIEAMKQSPDAFEKLFQFNPLSEPDEEATKKRQAWLDFNLLPPFEQIAKYFHYTVQTGSFQGEGFNLKVHSPNPPGFK